MLLATPTPPLAQITTTAPAAVPTNPFTITTQVEQFKCAHTLSHTNSNLTHAIVYSQNWRWSLVLQFRFFSSYHFCFLSASPSSISLSLSFPAFWALVCLFVHFVNCLPFPRHSEKFAKNFITLLNSVCIEWKVQYKCNKAWMQRTMKSTNTIKIHKHTHTHTNRINTFEIKNEPWARAIHTYEVHITFLV